MIQNKEAQETPVEKPQFFKPIVVGTKVMLRTIPNEFKIQRLDESGRIRAIKETTTSVHGGIYDRRNTVANYVSDFERGRKATYRKYQEFEASWTQFGLISAKNFEKVFIIKLPMRLTHSIFSKKIVNQLIVSLLMGGVM